MVGTIAQALHRIVPQACPQPFAQLLPRQVLLWSLLEQLHMPGHEQWQVFGHQAQVAHRRGHLDLLQAPTGQFEEQRRIALGPQQPHRDQGVGAFGVLQVQDKTLHAAVATTEKGRQVGGQATQGKQQRLVGLHIEVQLDAQVETIRRLVEGQPQRTFAKQGIELLEQAGVEAPGQALARQLPELGEAAHAHARQGRGLLRCQSQALDGHRPQGLVQVLLAGHRQAIVGIGQDPGRRRVRSRDDAMAKAQCLQFLAQASLQLWPRPEQAQARFDFQHQGARIGHADLGAEAIGPGGKEPLPVIDLPEVVLGTGEILGQGLGGCQRLSGTQPQLAGSVVHRLDHSALRAAAEQRQRRLGLGALAQYRVQRQLREQDAHPAHVDLSARPAGQSVVDGPGHPGT